MNELPLEEYLYAVIPSEMPTYYGTEALKVRQFVLEVTHINIFMPIA